jgi:hypothetical protein
VSGVVGGAGHCSRQGSVPSACALSAGLQTRLLSSPNPHPSSLLSLPSILQLRRVWPSAQVCGRRPRGPRARRSRAPAGRIRCAGPRAQPQPPPLGGALRASADARKLALVECGDRRRAQRRRALSRSLTASTRGTAALLLPHHPTHRTTPFPPVFSVVPSCTHRALCTVLSRPDDPPPVAASKE